MELSDSPPSVEDRAAGAGLPCSVAGQGIPSLHRRFASASLGMTSSPTCAGVREGPRTRTIDASI